MAKKLINMTWEEVKAEMSLAGSPDKVIKLADSIMRIIEVSIDDTNHAELTNIMFALDRIKAEVEGAQKRLEKRTSIKLSGNEHVNPLIKDIINSFG